jgi:RNA polymerase sigma factor (sigma-70 family)
VKDPERQQLREQLISGYLPVAKHIARRFARRREPLEDLVQVATVGLINAVDRFEPTRGSISFPARYRLSPANYAGTSATTAGQRGFRAD